MRRTISPRTKRLAGNGRVREIVVCLVTLGAVSPAWLAGQAAKSAPTSLTVYTDGRVFARRVFAVAVPKGETTQRVQPGPLDPGSLVALDPDVTIHDARYDTVSSEQTALRRSVGRKFTFQSQSYPPVPIVATLLATDPERWRLEDGTVLFQRPGLIRWPDDLVAFEPALELRLRAAQSKPALALGYFTAGAFWRASYQVILGGATTRVRGVAVITSLAMRVDSAEIQLLAGAIAQPPQPRPYQMAEVLGTARKAGVAAGIGTEERVEESHVYTLAGRWSLRPGSTSLLPLFDESSTGVVREYVVRREPIYGIYPENEAIEEPPVQVEYTLARPRKTGFGDQPLPAGTARLFRTDSDGRLQVVGEAGLDHTAPGKELVLKAGNAFDLSARRRQTDFLTARDSSAAGVRTRAEGAYEVTLANATDSAASVLVQESRAGEWSVISSSVPGEKVSATLTRFRVTVPARGQTVLTYRIRAIW